MNHPSGLLKVIVAAGFAAGFSTVTLRAQLIPATGDLFSSTDTVTVSSSLDAQASINTYPVSNLVDGSPTGAFVFADDGLLSPEQQSISITGFNSAIDSISFYDYFGSTDGTSRDPNSVIISYSLTAQTSLNPSDYTALNGGLAFNLPQTGSIQAQNGMSTEGIYVNSTTYSSGGSNNISYDTLSGLNIPAGTQSVLLTFNSVLSASDTYYGGAFSEIQAFAPSDVGSVPEPSTWAMFLLGGSILAGVRFSRLRNSHAGK